MQTLSPEELLKHATHFAAEERMIAQGKGIAVQIRSVLDQPPGELEPERSITFEALGAAVIRSLERYHVGADLPVVAWTTRNIFELEIMLAFVTASPENAKSFADDVVLDEIQVREAGIALSFDRRDPEVARRQDDALERLRRRKAELGLTRNGPMSTREMARRLGREAEYNAHNKLYSKIVHPTAYRLIGGRLESTNWAAYGLHVMYQGVQKAALFLETLSTVRKDKPTLTPDPERGPTLAGSPS
jgi:hypothetical protein